jgi:heme/copper-type cytochrome/quinol oxidase subunit 2
MLVLSLLLAGFMVSLYVMLRYFLWRYRAKRLAARMDREANS